MPRGTIPLQVAYVVARLVVGGKVTWSAEAASADDFPIDWDRHEILGAGAGGRWMPSFFMRASRVVGLRPSRLAAPLGPLTRQLFCSSTLMM